MGWRHWGGAAAPEVVVEMEAPSKVRHMGNGMAETELDSLNRAVVLEVWMSRDVFIGKFL